MRSRWPERTHDGGDSDKERDRLLFEPGRLGLFVIGIAAATVIIRRGAPARVLGDAEHA